MNDFWVNGVALIMAKAGVIAASAAMAVVSVLIDRKRHTFISACLAIIAGSLLGVIAASAITALMNWPEQVGYGIASVFAISGNNLIKWLLRVSNDPLSVWLRFWGK